MLYPQPNASGSTLQTCINFVEQRLKFFHFEGSIIPFSALEIGLEELLSQKRHHKINLVEPVQVKTYCSDTTKKIMGRM